MLNLRNNVQQIPWTFRDMVWDEQDRLMAVIDNQSRVSHYVYDHTGERTFKSEGHINEVNIAGQNIYRVLNFEKYLIYPSGYVVLNPEKDEYTKHYYINNKRFVSRIGKNYFEYFKLSGSSGLTAGEDLPKNNFDELARDNNLEMPEAVYSPINIGNSPENCNQQLDVIEAMYNTPQTPLCLQQIQYIRANSSPCDALVLINSITFENCAGNDPGNEPDPDVDPEDEYTGEEMSELDCLSQINILLNGLTPLPAITGFSLKNTAVECDNDCHYYCRTECDKKCADSNDPNCYNKCEKECHEQWIEDNTPTPEPEPEDECESVCYGNCYIACDGDPDCIAYCYNHCMNNGCDTFPTPSGPAQECEEHCYEVYYNNGNEEQLAYCLFKCREEETPQNTCEQQCYENCNGDPNCMAECYYECTQDPEVVACKKTCEELCEGDPDCTQNCEQAFCGNAGGTSPCGRDCYVDCKEICSKECNGDPDCIVACIPDCMENISEETLKKCKLECLEQCNGDLDCLAACVKKCDETIVIHDPEKSCEENGMILIQEFLMLEPQMTACEILLYLNTYYYPCEAPSVPVVTPPDYVDIEDDWQDTGGNDTLPEEDFEIEPTDPIWWYHTDHLGSSTYLTNIFGRPSHYYETLPFGEMMVEHNQSLYTAGQYNNAYKFNGKELDEFTQMYYYGARYYDPRFSIFVSVDPLAEETMEPYSDVGNNPIMFTDPTGMAPEKIIPRGLSAKQTADFKESVNEMSKRSFLFKALYDKLEASPKNHYVEMNSELGTGVMANSEGGSTLYLQNMIDMTYQAGITEELFHMYQYDNGGNDSELNWEFEAKTFVMISSQDFRIDEGVSKGYIKTLKDNFSGDVTKKNKKLINSLKNNFFDSEFNSNYMKEANIFSKYNRDKNIGGETYQSDTKTAPKNIQKLVNELDGKK